jgi:hypothetical protein
MVVRLMFRIAIHFARDRIRESRMASDLWQGRVGFGRFSSITLSSPYTGTQVVPSWRARVERIQSLLC